MSKKKLLAAGGDLRMLYAAAELSDKYDVMVTGFSENKLPGAVKEMYRQLGQGCDKADVLLLPPVASDNKGGIPAPFSENAPDTAEIIGKVSEGGTVLLGIKGEAAEKAGEGRGLYYYNYMNDEVLALANAIPTAEGAIKTAIEETGSTIWGSRVVVMGFGRTGAVLADRLLKLGADVTAAARKERDRMRIKAMGAKASGIKLSPECLSEADIIFNTVPAIIFGKEELERLKKGCVFIELASAPGGADKKIIDEAGCKYVWATGLPAKGMC
ncbi:MAG: dipicolinate synthase subunit DpsA [Ruminococcus sp.]